MSNTLTSKSDLSQPETLRHITFIYDWILEQHQSYNCSSKYIIMIEMSQDYLKSENIVNFLKQTFSYPCFLS